MRADMPPDHDVFEYGHLGKKADVLEGSGDARLGHFVHGCGGVGLAVELEAPGIRGVEAGDDIEEGGLAGAVGSDQAVDLTALDRDADIGERLQTAEALVGTLHQQQRCVGGGGGRRRVQAARDRAHGCLAPVVVGKASCEALPSVSAVVPCWRAGHKPDGR